MWWTPPWSPAVAFAPFPADYYSAGSLSHTVTPPDLLSQDKSQILTWVLNILPITEDPATYSLHSACNALLSIPGLGALLALLWTSKVAFALGFSRFLLKYPLPVRSHLDIPYSLLLLSFCFILIAINTNIEYHYLFILLFPPKR